MKNKRWISVIIAVILIIMSEIFGLRSYVRDIINSGNESSIQEMLLVIFIIILGVRYIYLIRQKFKEDEK